MWIGLQWDRTWRGVNLYCRRACVDVQCACPQKNNNHVRDRVHQRNDAGGGKSLRGSRKKRDATNARRDGKGEGGEG